MSEHTLGPYRWQNMGGWMLVAGRGMVPIILAAGDYDMRLRDERDLLIPFDPEHSDAKFIVDAMNSYHKHFGTNAVQAAEQDALGEALGLLREVLENRVFYADSMDINEYLNDDIRALLSRLKGGSDE